MKTKRRPHSFWAEETFESGMRVYGGLLSLMNRTIIFVVRRKESVQFVTIDKMNEVKKRRKDSESTKSIPIEETRTKAIRSDRTHKRRIANWSEKRVLDMKTRCTDGEDDLGEEKTGPNGIQVQRWRFANVFGVKFVFNRISRSSRSKLNSWFGEIERNESI